MNPHMIEQMTSQHQDDLRTLRAQSDVPHRTQQAGQDTADQGHPGVIRRRAGWALVSLGLRLAYAAGED
ncbi:MAG TPA: hypothetical protein VGL63_14550 [Streptosporangiaceae bacterium]|jgi:hypothetical protein